jgi:hypothetical protein
VVAATGDETIRTSVYDVVRGRIWPHGYTGRVMREKWTGHEKEHASVRAYEIRKIEDALQTDDFETANVTVGETIGLVHDIPKAGDLINRIVADAARSDIDACVRQRLFRRGDCGCRQLRHCALWEQGIAPYRRGRSGVEEANVRMIAGGCQ